MLAWMDSFSRSKLSYCFFFFADLDLVGDFAAECLLAASARNRAFSSCTSTADDLDKECNNSDSGFQSMPQNNEEETDSSHRPLSLSSSSASNSPYGSCYYTTFNSKPTEDKQPDGPDYSRRVINEIIETEDAYVTDLATVIEVWIDFPVQSISN